MAKLIRRGDRGSDVTWVQKKINDAIRLSDFARKEGVPYQGLLPPTPLLAEDGIFGRNTDSAVKQYQVTNGLADDGLVGPNTGGKLDRPTTIKDHNIKLIPQPTSATCWAASIAMLTRLTLHDVVWRAPKQVLLKSSQFNMKYPKPYPPFDYGLNPGHAYADNRKKQSSWSGDTSTEKGMLVARTYGLKFHPPMSWSPEGFADVLKQSPLAIAMLLKAQDYASGYGHVGGHLLVVGGICGLVEPTGSNMFLKCLDPWEPNVGKISWTSYDAWMAEYPARTFWVFERPTPPFN